MIKVKIIATGEVREVTRNVAFDLIDRKVAKVYGPDTDSPAYNTRKMGAAGYKKYKVK